MRKSAVSTHIALTIEQAGKLNQSINYAQAILTLIQNDSINNTGKEPDEFFTATDIIKTAISAVGHFIEIAQANSQQGEYLTLADKPTA